MGEIKRLLNSLLWEIYGLIPSSISRKHRRARQMKMHPRLYEPRLLEKLNINVIADVCAILKLEIQLMSKYLERVLISRDKNRTQQTILYGFLDVIVSSRFGESSREMRFSLSPPSGTVQGRGDPSRPVITDETNSSSDFNQWLHAMKLVARLPGGMPPEFRRKLWLALADKYLKSKNVDWEKEEIKCFSEQWREDDEELGIQIVKDLHRTGSSLCSGPAGTINQAKLKRILLGYARYNPEVGYCQGFNMLGALILQVMDKEEIESIKVMIYLVEGILPRGYFSGSLGGLQADMAVFRELMTCKLPRLAKHLQKLQGPVENAFEPPLTNVFTMQWFLTMFCTCLPMTCVLRVWDLVLIEGSDVLLRTALVLWSLLEERILNTRTADDFYCKMGSFSSELLNGHLIDSNGLIEKVVDLGPIPELQKLRDKHLYNISPFRDKDGLQLYYSDEEGDSDEDSRMAVATAWGLRLNRRGSAGLGNKTDGKDRIALDISLLKKQYDRLRERQRQAHIILTSAVARQGSNPNQSSIQMNQLLIGRNAIVTNNGRRLGPPQGAIPPARKPSLPTAKSPKLTQTKSLRRGETLHWRDTELSKRRRGSLKWKDIKSDSSQSGQDDRTPQLTESAPSSRSSSSEPKSQRASMKTHQRSDSSSYSEDSDGNSSTSTSLCDEDDHENVSSLEVSPMKKSKLSRKHSEVPQKKCLEDVLNSDEKQHTVDSQIPFIQLTTIDSPVLNANKTDIDSIEFSKEDSETESNRLDYAGFVDEYSWPDMMEATSSVALEDITIDVTSDEQEFLSLTNAITSTSQLSPIPDITTYINNSNISPLRTPISAFDYTNLVVDIDESKKFDVNDEGVTNEYFERINIVERPTKLDLLYSLNEEDSIRNAYQSCQPSPESAYDDSLKEKSTLESSTFQAFESSTKSPAPSMEESDRKMKVLLEYSNQSSLSFIAEAKHEISTGKFKEKEFDAMSLKYQPSVLVPSKKALPVDIPTTDETIENIFLVPSVAVKSSTTLHSSETLKGSAQAIDSIGMDENSKTVLTHDIKITEASGSFKSLTKADDLREASESQIDSKPNEICREEKPSETGQNRENTAIHATIKGGEIVKDSLCHIPSTEDLETRFRALEINFSVRRGSSSEVTDAKNDNKLPANNQTEFTNNETENLQKCIHSDESAQRLSLSDASTLAPANRVNNLPEASISNADIITLDKEDVLEIENQDSNHLAPTNLDKDDGIIIDSISTSAKELPSQDETQAMAASLVVVLSTETPVNGKPSFPTQATILEGEKGNDAKYQSIVEQTSKDNQPQVLKEENLLLGLTYSPKSVVEANSGKVALEPYSKIDRLQYSVDVSDEDNNLMSNKPDQSVKESEVVNLEIEQLPSLDMSKMSSTKEVLEVDPMKPQLPADNSARSETQSDENLPTSSLSYCRDHFGDEITSQSKFGNSDIPLCSPIFQKQRELTTSSDIAHSKFTTQNSDEKTEFVEKQSNRYLEENLIKRPKLENLNAEQKQFNTESTINKGLHTSGLEPVKLPLSPLIYSENHFDKKHTTQPTLENLVIEQKPEIKKPESLPQFLKDHDEKFQSLEKPPSVGEISNQLDDEKSPNIDKISTQLRFENSVEPDASADKKHKSRIPSTEDLESRYMALERKFSEKAITLPEDIIDDQPNAKEKIPKKESVDNSDSTAKTVTPVAPDTKTTKTIPSTADLEHRFRELERKLSATSINSSKTTVPQQDDLKALKQSNIVKNPSIVLPNTEDRSAANTTSKSHEPNDQPPFIRKRIPSTEDLETRFKALEIQKSLKSPTALTLNLLSPSKMNAEFSISSPEMDIASKRKSEIPSIEDLENRFEALEQSKLVQKPSNETPADRKEEIPKSDGIIPSTKDLETRFEALEQRKLETPSMVEKKMEQVSKKVPSTRDLEARFEALEQPVAANNSVKKRNCSESDITRDGSKTKALDNKIVPSTEDLEIRYEALEQKKPTTDAKDNETISSTSGGLSERKSNDGEKIVPSTLDLENRFNVLEQQKSTRANQITSRTSQEVQSNKKPPPTQDLETRFETLDTDCCLKEQTLQENKNIKLSDSLLSGKEAGIAVKSSLRIEQQKCKESEFEPKQLQKEPISPTKVPSLQDLKTTFDALEHQKSVSDCSTDLAKSNKKISKVPSTHDLEKRFDNMQIDTKMMQTEPKDSNAVTSERVQKQDAPTTIEDPKKRTDLYKLESQSDDTLTATDQTSEFDAKTESRPTSCPEYSDSFDSNIVTTDRVLKIIEENSKILHRILKKTLADTSDSQSKKSHPGLTDSLLALGNIFPRSNESVSPSRMKSHSWIRPPSIKLCSDDNISDRLASIKSTIKSIDTLCEEKSFRKEKCQRYIDSLFARPTITTVAPVNPSIKVEDFECKPSSQDRIAKRELKKDTSPRRRRDEDREEYESRVRRDMMPNSLDAPSDFSFSLANIEQVDSEVDRINSEKQVDTQLERPLSPYYVSGYDLNKRSITPVVYIPTKLEIRHTTVTSTFYDRYLTEKHMERTFPRSKKSPVSPTVTKSYLDISKINFTDRSSKSAENSPSRRRIDSGLSPNKTTNISSAINKRDLVSTLEAAQKDLHIRSCDNILLQLRTSTHNNDIVPSIMVYNPLPTKIRKPPELGISLGLYKDYGSDESSKS